MFCVGSKTEFNNQRKLKKEITSTELRKGLKEHAVNRTVATQNKCHQVKVGTGVHKRTANETSELVSPSSNDITIIISVIHRSVIGIIVAKFVGLCSNIWINIMRNEAQRYYHTVLLYLKLR